MNQDQTHHVKFDSAKKSNMSLNLKNLKLSRLFSTLIDLGLECIAPWRRWCRGEAHEEINPPFPGWTLSDWLLISTQIFVIHDFSQPCVSRFRRSWIGRQRSGDGIWGCGGLDRCDRTTVASINQSINQSTRRSSNSLIDQSNNQLLGPTAGVSVRAQTCPWNGTGQWASNSCSRDAAWTFDFDADRFHLAPEKTNEIQKKSLKTGSKIVEFH